MASKRRTSGPPSLGRARSRAPSTAAAEAIKAASNARKPTPSVDVHRCQAGGSLRAEHDLVDLGARLGELRLAMALERCPPGVGLDRLLELALALLELAHDGLELGQGLLEAEFRDVGRKRFVGHATLPRRAPDYSQVNRAEQELGRASGQHRRYIRCREVIALEEERLAGELGEGIGEAIAEVEPCRMAAAAAEVAVGLARDARLALAHRLDGECRHAEELVETAAGDGIAAAVYDDGGLDEIDRRDAAAGRVFN